MRSVNRELFEPRIAVSDTGPMISALQCGRVDILRQFYDVIHIPASELLEYQQHGAKEAIQELMDVQFIVVHDDLTALEREEAQQISVEIALSAQSRDKEPRHHHPEAEAIVLVGRTELKAIELLLDELAAREVAKRRGVPIVGFPGVLIRACQQGLITPEDVRESLQECQRQGTHYATQFIEGIYERLRRA